MMETSNDGFNFPSGVQLPFIIRKKLEEQEAVPTGDGGSEQHDDVKFMTAVASPDRDDEGSLSADREDDALAAKDLEGCLWKTSVALVEIQKQIHRGEETYYEDTFGHGNIFKGWEGFLDAKDVGTASSSKPPRDSRWFSSSSSISRSSRPPAINTQLPVSAQQQLRQLSNKTPTSATSATFTASTPLEQTQPPSTTSFASTSASASPAMASNTLSSTAATSAIKHGEAGAETSDSLSTPASNHMPPPPTESVDAVPTKDEAPTPPAQPATTLDTARCSEPPLPAQTEGLVLTPPKESTDSFRIPKKKKNSDSSIGITAGAPVDPLPLPAVQPPSIGTQQTESQQSTTEAELTDSASKKGRARKRKAGE